MKTYKTSTRFNESKNLNEVNCIGFFNNSFFSLIELIRRQDEVYALYLNASGETRNECAELYEVLEHMRVALIINK